MKKLMNLKNAKILSKKEQKNVFGGKFSECQTIINGEIYWGLTVSEAQSYYNQAVAVGASTGYCCASCSGTSWAIQ